MSTSALHTRQRHAHYTNGQAAYIGAIVNGNPTSHVVRYHNGNWYTSSGKMVPHAWHAAIHSTPTAAVHEAERVRRGARA